MTIQKPNEDELNRSRAKNVMIAICRVSIRVQFFWQLLTLDFVPIDGIANNTRTEPNESAPALSRSEVKLINI